MSGGVGGVRDSLGAGMLPSRWQRSPAAPLAFPLSLPSLAAGHKSGAPGSRRARAGARPRATEIIAPEIHVPTAQGDPLDK